MTFLPSYGPQSHASGGSRIRGVWPAIVVDNKDGKDNPGFRVKVKLPWLSEQDTTFWARIAVPMAGPDRGTYVLPEIDDQVLVVFEHGDINRPIVVGALWSKKDEPVEVNQSGKNNTKLIKSRCGHRIIFDDKNGAEKLVIVDKTKKNKIVLDSVNKVVKIESGGDIEVTAQTNVIMHANALRIGISDSATGKAQSLLGHAQKTFGLKATSGITIGGGTTTINTSSPAACSVSGSGAGELGAPGSETPKDQIEATVGGGGGSSSGGAGSGAAAAAAASAAPPAASSAAPASTPPRAAQLHQLEVAVVNPRSVAQSALEFRLTLPDGSVRTGATDRDGFIRLTGLLQTGDCKLLFPSIPRPGTDNAAQPAHVRYVDGGITVTLGRPVTVEVPPVISRVRLTGMHFETDKAFLLPGALTSIRRLAAFYRRMGDLHVLVTGHTDTVGSDSYNVGLSTERADAFAAFLLDDADAWLAWYQGKPNSRAWGTREDQYMLATLPEHQPPYYTAGIDGARGPGTTAALQRFQADHGLPVTGIADRSTRRQLIADYMAIAGMSLPRGTPVSTHGCGPYHLIRPTGPGVDSLENRRVEVFLFDGEIAPRPRALCNDCPQYPVWLDRTLFTYPIDQADSFIEIAMLDEQGRPTAGAYYVVTALDGTTRDGTLDDHGTARIDGLTEGHVDIRFPDLDAAAWGRP